jgi:hypothetical protein
MTTVFQLKPRARILVLLGEHGLRHFLLLALRAQKFELTLDLALVGCCFAANTFVTVGRGCQIGLEKTTLAFFGHNFTLELTGYILRWLLSIEVAQFGLLGSVLCIEIIRVVIILFHVLQVSMLHYFSTQERWLLAFLIDGRVLVSMQLGLILLRSRRRLAFSCF